MWHHTLTQTLIQYGQEALEERVVQGEQVEQEAQVALEALEGLEVLEVMEVQAEQALEALVKEVAQEAEGQSLLLPIRLLIQSLTTLVQD